MAGAEISGRQDFNAHFRRNDGAIFGADRAIENMAHMGIVAKQIGAVEVAMLGQLLRDFERRHRAHLEIAALQGLHFGALAEQGRGRIDLDLHPSIGAVNRGFEPLQAFRQKITRRGGGRNPQQCRRLGAGAGGKQAGGQSDSQMATFDHRSSPDGFSHWPVGCAPRACQCLQCWPQPCHRPTGTCPSARRPPPASRSAPHHPDQAS